MRQKISTNKISLVHRPTESHLSSLCLWVSAGSKHDSVSGISHFLEHMLFKGNRRKSAKQLAEEIENTGAIMNAFTMPEGTCFQVQFLNEQLDDILQIMAEMLTRTEFKNSEIELERKVIVEEIKASLDSPEERLNELVFESLWPQHNLGKPIAGTLQTVLEIDKQALQHYYKANYKSENFSIACVSSIDEAIVLQKINEYFPAPQQKPVTKTQVQNESIQMPKGKGWLIQKQEIKKDLEHAYIHLAFPFQSSNEWLKLAKGNNDSILSYSDKLFFQAVSYMLTEGFSSRLFQELREKYGLVYSLNSQIESYEEGNFWGLYFSATHENVQQVIEVIEKTILQLVKNKKPFSKAEIERAQKHLATRALMNMQNGLDYAERLGFQKMIYGAIFEATDLEREIKELADEQKLNEKAQKFFSSIQPLIIGLTPKKIKTKKL